MTQTVDFLLLTGLCNIDDFFGVKSETTMSSRMLGPSKVAQRARDAGYSAQVIDFVQFIPDQVLYPLLDQFIGPDTVLGISVTHLVYIENMQDNAVINKVKRIIQHYRDQFGTKVLIGGYSADSWASVFSVDHVIVGKAENEVGAALDRLINHGISRQQSKFWDITTCNHQWHTSDRIMPTEVLPLEVGRGCIFHCKFCKFEYLGKRKGSYTRDMQLIRDELMRNHEQYQVTAYNIVDDTFNDDIDKLKAWYDMVMSLPFKIQYSCYLRADLLHKHKESAQLLVDSGLHACAMGIETLHPVAAKCIGKPWSAKHAREYLPELKKTTFKNVVMGVNFILGLPGEPVSSMKDTFAWAQQQEISCKFFPLSLDLEILARSKANPNVIASVFEQEWEKYGYTFPTTSTAWVNDQTSFEQVARMSYRFARQLGLREPVTSWDSVGLSTLGYDFEYLRKTPRLEIINSSDFAYRRQKFIDRYVEQFST